MAGKGAATRKGEGVIPYAILRFTKHTGGSARAIEAHHERQKDSYASNPDIDTSRSPCNYHIVQPGRNYSKEIQGRIEAAGCRTRKDSVRYVDTLITATPEFFQGKSEGQVRGFFQTAVKFLESELGRDNIFSAVVHMDEKTPHMHLCFTPITKDNRLSAKEVIGNRVKMQQWQDKFYNHMAQSYPELERGQPAQQTRRKHIPARLFKKAVRLDGEMEYITQALGDMKLGNISSKREEIQNSLEKLLPRAESFLTEVQYYQTAIENLQQENTQLNQTVQGQQDTQVDMHLLRRKVKEYEKVIDSLPPELRTQLPLKRTRPERTK